MKKITLTLPLAFCCFVNTIFAQLGRQIIPLNDDWTFENQQVNIPHTFNAKDTGYNNFHSGEVTYKKALTADTAWKNKRVFIRFEGVGDVADLYVDNKFVGEHKGAYAAFCFEITGFLRYDSANDLVVKVDNTPRKDIIPINNFLFPIYGGIYRPVALIVTDRINITTTDYASPGVYISQKNVSESGADISVKVKLENTYYQAKNLLLTVQISDEKGKLIRQTERPISLSPQGRLTFILPVHLDNPHLWNGRKDPYLYKVVTSVSEGYTLLDMVAQPLGIRRVEIVAGEGFYLNGKPYRLYGVCRHQDILGYGDALSNAQQDTDMAMIKELGATSIRFGHYQQEERVYQDCDSIGFLVWTEVPFVNAVSGQEAYNAEQQMTELIRQNFNHPSIFCWGTSNEVYGRTPGDYTSQLITRLNDIAKTEDPDRYSTSTSGSGQIDRPENFHTDLQGINRYYGWYEGKMGDLDAWIDGAERNYPDARIALTEYGAEANIYQQSAGDTILPQPYDGQFFPEGYQTRLHEVQWGIIQKHPYLFATYIWNMFDFSTPLWNRGGIPGRNMKGLVTFDRKVKKDAFFWYKANWSAEPVVYITGRRDSLRQTATTNITVYSNISPPRLFVNGRKAAHPATGTTKVAFIFNDIHLRKGANTITATGARDGKTYKDSITIFRIR